MQAQEKWRATWPSNIHETEDAKKRIQSSKSAKLTPVSVDSDGMTGVFKGSGRQPYNVSLESCTCVDFIRNKKPCKHMYRLATELGALGDAKDDVQRFRDRGMAWEEVADIVEELSEDAQLEFISLIRGLKKLEPMTKRKKKKPEIDELIEAGLFETDPQKETPKFYVISIVIDYTAEIFKVYQYFNRKFYPPRDLIDDGEGGMLELFKPLANDDRTARLIKKGFAVETPDGAFIKDHLPE